MSALISRTDDIICMLDVNMMVEKLKAMLKFFETDTQTDRQTHRHTDFFKKVKSDIRKVF